MRLANPLEFDPSTLGWPPSLPLELALRTAEPEELRMAYGISVEEWAQLQRDPAFLKAVKSAVDEMAKDGGFSVKAKARMQFEEMLKVSWQMVHDRDCSPAVRADLIKFTARLAGVDGSDKGTVGAGNGFSININLSPSTPSAPLAPASISINTSAPQRECVTYDHPLDAASDIDWGEE